jgi:hypothetical protein
MKAYFTNLPMKIWVLLVVPAVAIAYPVVMIVVPAVVRAVVPEVVRTVLSVIWAPKSGFDRFPLQIFAQSCSSQISKPLKYVGELPRMPSQKTFVGEQSTTEDPKPKTVAGERRSDEVWDEVWMEEALRCAQRALESGEVPVGAVAVCEGRIVGRGWNRNIAGSDPTAHAEIIALREAGATIGNHRLGDCEGRRRRVRNAGPESPATEP